MKHTLAALALLALVASPARAHDIWADGSPVSPKTKAQCCGDSEEHVLRPDQVHPVKGGYMLDGWPDLVPYDQVTPSPDGVIRAFWIIFPGGTAGPEGGVVAPYRLLRCVFMPPAV